MTTLLMTAGAWLLAYAVLFLSLPPQWRPVLSQLDELAALALIFGSPVLLCAWPVYLVPFQWLLRQQWTAGRTWWLLPVVGVCLVPVPVSLEYLVLAIWQRRVVSLGQVIEDLAGTIIFAVAFGLFLGLAFAIRSRPGRI
ncbi:MAG: hypothetical protein ABL993_00845 [Vicinamibacterales bacterium]